jgi:hypothetical protein
VLFDFRDRTVRLLDLSFLLIAFVFSLSDVAPSAVD